MKVYIRRASSRTGIVSVASSSITGALPSSPTRSRVPARPDFRKNTLNIAIDNKIMSI